MSRIHNIESWFLLYQDKKHGDWEHRDLHNMYGMLYTMATHQGQLVRADSTRRPFILTRSAFAGSQRYGTKS
jgi:alpha 1,3-glucosidase